jgi:hypothetical protein
MTVATWADKALWSNTAKTLVNQAIRGLLTIEATDVSYLFWLNFIRGSATLDTHGDIMRLAEVKNGAQQDRIKGGSYTVSQRYRSYIF